MNANPQLVTFEHDGHRFRDLDHDGVLAPYEDWRLTPEQRAGDLLTRLTDAEKAGLLCHGTAPSVHPFLGSVGVGESYDLEAAAALINVSAIHSMITRLSTDPVAFARQNNELQAVAASGRLGIPLTISTDPRSHRNAVLGAGVGADRFSIWPGPLGLAATRDPDLLRRFGEIVRVEYRAVGIHVSLAPQADLSTSPRWPRSDGTFGEDPKLVRALTGAYVEGMQGGREGVGATGVACVVKHWAGYGASRDGFDAHEYYGRYSAFPAGRFDDHVEAFLDALAYRVAAVMPTYTILEGLLLDGTPIEQVGGGFCSALLEGLLRDRHGFEGLVLSDWGIMRNLTEAGKAGSQNPDDIAMCWGVEDLDPVARVAKGINAGLDQIGGENDPSALLDAMRAGLIAPSRIDSAVRRVLMQTFRLGLFEQPFVDADTAADVLDTPDHHELASATQRRSLVVLKSDRAAGTSLLSDDDSLHQLSAPFEVLHPEHFFGSRQHEGSLAFPDGDPGVAAVEAARSEGKRTVVVVDLDRAAILAPIVAASDVLVVSFGVDDGHVLHALRSGEGLDGRLPFELPSSMDAVLASCCDAPHDSVDPLFACGFSLHS